MICDLINYPFNLDLRLVFIFAFQVEHTLEDVPLVELDFLHLVSRHIGKVDHKAHHIRRVALEVVVGILTDSVVPSLWVSAWNVHELVRVEGIS